MSQANDTSNSPTERKPVLFPLGRVCATPGALETLRDAKVSALALLQRHMRGDWGKVPPEDARTNQQALACGDRVLSSYQVGTATVWVITEADRSVTTVLLPSEY